MGVRLRMNEKIASKDGIQIQKGFMLTEDWVLKNRDTIEKWLNCWLAYPDIMLDIYKPSDSQFKFYFYQRLFMRATMRFRYVFGTFTRAYSKSFMSILTRFVRCSLLPGEKSFVCTDVKKTGVKVMSEKITEIFRLFPLLEKEVLVKHESNDYIEIIFRNGSMFDVVGTTAGTRGIRRHSGVFDEAALLDGNEVNERVLPTLNVSRRDILGRITPGEKTQSQIWITSAGPKACYAYEKLIDFTVISILSPDTAYVAGGDYRVPAATGLLDGQYIEDLKLSSSYNADSFGREFLSIWSGSSADSWINSDKLQKYRTILRAERQASARSVAGGAWYMCAVDVGRFSCNTVITVVKCVPKDTYFQKRLVNIIVINGDKFIDQTIKIKKLHKAFHFREICIDTNGIGSGLTDYMMDTQIDPETGEMLEPLGIINDENYPNQDPSWERVVYALKANATLNTQIHSNFYTQVTGGHVRFLAHERDARSKLMETVKGQRMTPQKRVEFLLPYEMTSRLFDEISNLKIKNTVANLEVERISSRILKDRFSSFEYNLWRIKEYEDKYYRQRRRNRDMSKYLFFTKGR